MKQFNAERVFRVSILVLFFMFMISLFLQNDAKAMKRVPANVPKGDLIPITVDPEHKLIVDVFGWRKRKYMWVKKDCVKYDPRAISCDRFALKEVRK